MIDAGEERAEVLRHFGIAVRTGMIVRRYVPAIVAIPAPSPGFLESGAPWWWPESSLSALLLRPAPPRAPRAGEVRTPQQR